MKRRLIGPTIICLILTGLLADHLFFSESPWSVINVLMKVVTILAAIFKPALDPKNWAWFDDYLLAVTMMVLVFVLLRLSFARAIRAMSKATPEADSSLAFSDGVQFSDMRRAVESMTAAAPTANAGSSLALSDGVRLSDSRRALESVTAGAPTASPPWRYPLIGKLTFGFGAIGILFGVAACVIVFGYFSRVYEKELVSRAQVTTIGLTDLVTRRLATKSANEIANDVEKYAAIKAVAYIYVEDANGAIIAHEPKDLPRYLNRDFPKSAERALHGVNVQYRGQEVFEVANRIGSGDSGFVHLGIGRDVIGVEARLALLPIAASIVMLLLGVTGMFIVIARRLNPPLLDLVEQADRINRGDFTVALSLKRTDEIGDIARSIERLRASLHAVVRRLEQEKSTEQPDKLPARSDR